MTIQTHELNGLLAFAEATAREAGARLQQLYRETLTISYKGKVNLVTQADQESEALIVSAIRQRYPTHMIIAEEGGQIDVEGSTAAGLTWVIDPLDGTTNYAHHFPIFAISIAVRSPTEILAGVVYDPMREECFTAAQGQGAKLNGELIRVSAIDDLGQALLATGFPYDVQEAPDNNVAAFSAFLRRAQAIRRPGSAALDLAYVASGRFDGYWEMRLHPWDIAAGILLVREAGGRVTDYEGGTDLNPMLAGRRIIATNGLIHPPMIEILREIHTQLRAQGIAD